jgi:RsiW-degrading membrane proteinase PrsW (M82 family)
MILDAAVRAPVGLLPVVVFLAVLVYFDSYKLVSLRAVIGTILVGAAAACGSYFANVAALDRLDVEFVTYSRYVSPLIEETIKALVIVVLIRAKRIAFLVDAAIAGFAVGTGFAVVENLYYLSMRPDSHIAVWVVRGFGTAVMHGGATAIFAIVSITLFEKKPGFTAFLPGLAAAALLHSAYNHFLFVPVLSTLGILIALPPLAWYVFRRSERAVGDWLGADFDADARLLELIDSDDFGSSNLGQYLQSLRSHFRGEVVADMLCYLRLHLELEMLAKGVLLMRETGMEPTLDPDARAKFDELRYLERSIGRTGKRAMQPFLHLNARDLWQIHMLDR